MVREITLEQMALNLEAAVNDVRDRHTQLVVIQGGRRVMAMVPIELYERWLADREKAFEYFDRLATRASTLTEEEVEEDVQRAIREVREGYSDQ